MSNYLVLGIFLVVFGALESIHFCQQKFFNKFPIPFSDNLPLQLLLLQVLLYQLFYLMKQSWQVLQQMSMLFAQQTMLSTTYFNQATRLRLRSRNNSIAFARSSERNFVAKIILQQEKEDFQAIVWARKARLSGKRKVIRDLSGNRLDATTPFYPAVQTLSDPSTTFRNPRNRIDVEGVNGIWYI